MDRSARSYTGLMSDSSDASCPAAIEFDGVWYSYPGSGVPAVEDVSLRVEPGERLGVLGPNGGGKSTLIKLALGLIEPDRGTVRVLDGEPARARRAGRIGSVSQRIVAEVAFPLSVRQVVAMPLVRSLEPWRRMDEASAQRVSQTLELVGIADQGDRPIGRLSGGQLQRVMIARAVVSQPSVLLLDEPTVGVDVSGQHRFADLLAGLHDELGLAIVVVSHDLRALVTGSDRVACLNRTLHVHTSPSGLTPQVLAEVFSHDVVGVLGEMHVDAHLAVDCDNPEHNGPEHNGPEHNGPEHSGCGCGEPTR